MANCSRRSPATPLPTTLTSRRHAASPKSRWARSRTDCDLTPRQGSAYLLQMVTTRTHTYIADRGHKESGGGCPRRRRRTSPPRRYLVTKASVPQGVHTMRMTFNITDDVLKSESSQGKCPSKGKYIAD